MSPSLLTELEAAWRRTDRLFDLLDDAWYERPIPLRHPFVFYLGHLPAFSWNQIGRGVLGLGDLRADFDELFERGIDPLDETEAEAVAIHDWPPLEEVVEYRDRARERIRELAPDLETRSGDDPLAENGRVLHLVLEHELMHHETLLYAVLQLDPERKRAPEGADPETAGVAPEPELVPIPGGEVTLGADFDDQPFAWDCELPRRTVAVDGFTLERRPVSVRDFHEFVDAGGYRDPRHWTAEDRAWIEKRGHERPLNWIRGADGSLAHRTMFGSVPLDAVLGWPALVSHAEAAAYARWRGARLPTEEELHRAAYGTPERTAASRPPSPSPRHPWGDDPPTERHGNFDFASWDPVPVGSRPAGRSAFGVDELVGNGWEWTDTDFAAHAGFRPWIRTYPGYSSDFFDGQHKVVFGAAWPTDRRLLRRSFRNWFQRRYPYVLATFRCVHGA